MSQKIENKVRPTPPAHPPYLQMVVDVVKENKSPIGMSSQAIRKRVLDKYVLEATPIRTKAISKALVKGLTLGVLKRPKLRNGEQPKISANGRFVIADLKLIEKPKAKPKVKKPTVKKPTTKKTTTATKKKTASKTKKSTKTTKSPAKSSKKTATKRPTKPTTKAKAKAKTPNKKVGKSQPAAKKTAKKSAAKSPKK